MGAVGFHYNKRHLVPEASTHKRAFAEYLAKKIQREDLIFHTERKGYKNFNLWLFKTSKISQKI